MLTQGEGLAEDEILACLQLPAQWLPELLSLAHLVRRRWCGDAVEVEGIVSVKTGGCWPGCVTASPLSPTTATTCRSPARPRWGAHRAAISRCRAQAGR
jgi:hypothetical protein